MSTENLTRTNGPIRPDIQGLRAIAVLAVVAFHAGLPVTGGFVGVDIFFVISGFVITAMLSREWAKTGRVNFLRFYERRLKRLSPALAIVIVAVMVATATILSPLGPQQAAANTAIGAVLLSANFVIERTTGGYFDAPAEINPLLNTWSLSVEEQFYLGFPALLALSWGLWRRPALPIRRSLVIVSGVALLSLAVALLGSMGVTYHGSLSLLGFYSPFARAWEFAAGALVAIALVRGAQIPRRLANIGGLVGAILVIGSLLLIGPRTVFPGVWTLMPVLGTILLIVSGSSGASHATRFLSIRPMVTIGDWSYSIYLWHWPLLVFAGVLWPGNTTLRLAMLVLALAAAITSYYTVESPIRKAKSLRPKQWISLLLLTVVLPLTAAATVRHVADYVWTPRMASVVQAQAPHLNYSQGCYWAPEMSDSDPAPCRWNSKATGAPIYLIGDSNAAHFAEGVGAAGEALNRPVVINTNSGCPVLGLRVDRPELAGYDQACADRSERQLSWLTAQPPGTVILSSTDDYWINPGYAVITQAGRTEDSATKVTLFRDALEGTVSRLQKSGHEVLLVQTLPHFNSGDWDLSRYTLSDVLRGGKVTMPLQESMNRTESVRVAVDRVAAATGAKVLDLSDEVCPGSICRNATESMSIYSDPAHITVAMSKELAPSWASALER
jgi:peptidoglycan/LPS O-acetylase OafA/YrhL